MEPSLAGLIISLFLAIFFSGVEVAFLSANKLQIELEGRHRQLSGMIMSFFIGKPSWFIGITLIGNLASLILFSGIATRLLVPVLMDAWPSLTSLWAMVVILTFILTLVVLYSAEFLSKSLFVINSNRMLSFMAIPFVLFAIVLFPVAFAVISLSRFIVSLIGWKYSTDKPVFGLTNVNQYLQTIHRIKPPENDLELDKKILNNALEFRTVRVRDCMIPRTEIVAVNIDSTIKSLQDAFTESGHSKIIVFRDSIDDVIGYCHSSALFKKPSKIEEILTSIVTIPESTLANELMIRFINERKSLAIVVDEFGGTSGLISMEDVIEEIFGDIEDEHDQDDLIEQKIDQNTFLLSARLEIDYINEKYKWELPTGDYETLGGLILQHVQDIPKPGATISIPGFTFIIQSTGATRINTVKVLLATP